MATEEELAAFRLHQQQLREQQQEKVRQATQRETELRQKQQEQVKQTTQREGPNAKAGEQAWQKLKTETGVTEQMKNATKEQKANWAQQEKDPKHVHGNSLTAHEKNAVHAKNTDLSQQSFPPMSEKAKAEVGGEIKKAMNVLKESLKQSQAPGQKPKL